MGGLTDVARCPAQTGQTASSPEFARPGLAVDVTSTPTLTLMDAPMTGIDRDIYPMPAFRTLVAADVERTVDWYVNGLDFVVLFTMAAPDGTPALVHRRRWRYQDILLRPGTDNPPEAGPSASWPSPTNSRPSPTAPVLTVADPWRDPTTHRGTPRDLLTTDPDGYTIVYTARRPEGQRDEQFTAMIEQKWQEQS